MAAGERDLWARCAPCQRWFFVPKAEAPMPEKVTCPVCGDHPRQFEGRDPQGNAPAVPAN